MFNHYQLFDNFSDVVARHVAENRPVRDELAAAAARKYSRTVGANQNGSKL